MSQKLAFIGIIILRKTRQLLSFSDVVKKCCADEKVMVEQRVSLCIILAQSGHRKSMLQQSAHKTVVYQLCCRAFSDKADEIRILFEKGKQKFLKKGIP